MMSAVGVGAALGAIAMASLGHRLDRRRLIVTATLFFSSVLALTAAHHSYPLALVGLAIIGFGSVLAAISINTLLQTEAPDHLRGRVLGFYSFVVLGLAPFGSLQAGWISEHFGVPVSFVVGALMCLLGALTLSWERRRRQATVALSRVSNRPVS